MKKTNIPKHIDFQPNKKNKDFFERNVGVLVTVSKNDSWIILKNKLDKDEQYKKLKQEDEARIMEYKKMSEEKSYNLKKDIELNAQKWELYEKMNKRYYELEKC